MALPATVIEEFVPSRTTTLSRRAFEDLTRDLSSQQAESTTDIMARRRARRSRSRSLPGPGSRPAPESYILVDTRTVNVFRQMRSHEVSNVVKAALHRHGNGDSGPFARTSLEIPAGRATVWWRLNSASVAGTPRRRVATLEATDAACTDGVWNRLNSADLATLDASTLPGPASA